MELLRQLVAKSKRIGNSKSLWRQRHLQNPTAMNTPTRRGELNENIFTFPKRFTPAPYKLILDGSPLELQDMATMGPTFYQANVLYILEGRYNTVHRNHIT